MFVIEKKNKLGEGVYGIVYQGEITDEDNVKTKVAIKRNYGDLENKGTCCLREMSYLSMFDHPNITKLISISEGDPFQKSCPMSPRPKHHDMKEDSHHFVMEFAGGDLSSFLSKNKNFYFLKIIMCQVLLAIEFIHSKGVLHRDLKPENIMISIGEDGLPYAKIIDFGLSCHPSHYRPTTPGASTSWYRAPEICCEYEYYSSPSDIWSIGCVFYQMVNKKPLIATECANQSTESAEIFKDIVKDIPQEFSVSEINEYIAQGIRDRRIAHKFSSKTKKLKFSQRFKKTNSEKFNKSGGTLEEFCDLLDKIFNLYPENRLSAKEALDHPFFSIFSDYIADMRKIYPPHNNELPPSLKIIDCKERRWAVNIAYGIYNNRTELDWYTDHIIFHSIRIFDSYLAYAFDDPEVKLKDKITRINGKLHTEQEVELYFYTCIYMTYKYFSTLREIYKWNKIIPKHLANSKNVKLIEKFEKNLIQNVLKYKFYSPTIIEYLDTDYNKKNNMMKDLDIRKYLVNYGDIGQDYTGTIADFYFQIKEGLRED